MGGQESDNEVPSVPALMPSTATEQFAAFREIDNAMSDCIYVILLAQTESGNLNSTVDIDLADEEKTRAEVLASKLDGQYNN